MKRNFWAAVMLFWMPWVLAQANLAVRLAIIPETSDANQVADLLAAELSKNSQIQLLERTDIDKVYHEQGLSAANRDYLKLGQVLGADGLLLLEISNASTNQFLNTRLIAVKPGVVLVDKRFLWPIKKEGEWSPLFAEHLNPFLPKLSVLAKDAIPISVVNIRSAVTSPEASETERELKALTIQRLSREPQLFVLERQRMQSMSEENNLEGVDDSGFWNGSYLIEGVFDRDGYTPGNMTINLELTPPKGGMPIKFSLAGSRTNLLDLINDLAKQLTSALQVATRAKPWNAADEAEEFFGEAKWAYRWGVLPEAQAASEAAWALGKRTKELSMLRIRAYADDVGSVNEHGNLFVPAYPDPEKLPALVRALELYCRDTPVIFTNTLASDPDSVLDGIRVFRLAVPLVDGFYQTAELREGRQEQLAELRRLCRQLCSILEAKVPQLDAEATAEVWSGRLPVSVRQLYGALQQQLVMYDLVKWEEGSVLFERPEDCLPLFRQMLERGFMPTERPRIIGWTWEERKRVPKVRRQFIEDLCASTNPAIRMDGLSLALISAGFYPEAEFHAREEELLAAIWNDRAWVFSRAEHAAILECAETILRDKYNEVDVNRCFTREPFASFRQNLRRAYLMTVTNIDPKVAEALFKCRYPTVSADEATELIPLLDKRTNENRAILNAASSFRMVAGVTSRNSMPSVDKPTMPPAEPMVVRFIPWTGDAFDAPPESRPQVQRLIIRGSELWAHVQYLKRNEFVPLDSPSYYVAVDQLTGRAKTISFPERLGSPDSGFEVTADSLYISVQNHLERFRFRENKWDSIAVPMVRGSEITEFAGRLYLSTTDSLLEVDPDSASVSIVASLRRRPPVDEMDTALGNGSHEFFRAGNMLGLSLGSQVFISDSGKLNWHRLAEFPFEMSPTAKYYSDQGVLFFSAGSRAQLTAVWIDNEAPALLLEQRTAFKSTNQSLTKPVASPIWEWPEPFPLDIPCLVAEGKSLWILVPRAARWPFSKVDERVIFQDDRQATLLYFGAGGRRPLAVPLRFEKDGRSTDPFDRDLQVWRFKMAPITFWLETPSGLVLACPNLMGHWLLPWPELEKRREPIPVIVPDGNGSKLSPGNTESIPP